MVTVVGGHVVVPFHIEVGFVFPSFSGLDGGGDVGRGKQLLLGRGIKAFGTGAAVPDEYRTVHCFLLGTCVFWGLDHYEWLPLRFTLSSSYLPVWPSVGRDGCKRWADRLPCSSCPKYPRAGIEQPRCN